MPLINPIGLLLLVSHAISSLYSCCSEFLFPSRSSVLTIIAIVGGAVPMLFVAYTSAPFVTFVHLRPPAFARRSRDTFLRFSKNLPADASIDITTMKFSSRQRVSKMRVADLKPTKGFLSIANLIRMHSSTTAKQTRPWWMGKPPSRFYVGSERGKSREKGVWQNVLNQIKQRS